MQNPKVSVLMGIYNCEKTLEEAVNSIVAQTYSNWELIMCDDGSVDSTYSLALSLMNRDPKRIIVLKNKHNLGLAATLNHCNKYATGELIARMDSDDISQSNRLEEQVGFLCSHPEYSLVGTYMESFDDAGVKGIIPIKAIPTKYDLPKFNPFHHATIVMKKSVFDELSGYTVSNDTVRAEDVDLWFRFFNCGYQGYNINIPLYLVREDSNTFSRRTFKHSLEASMVLYKGIKLLRLPFPYYIYVFKPVVSQLVPKKIKVIYRSRLKDK